MNTIWVQNFGNFQVTWRLLSPIWWILAAASFILLFVRLVGDFKIQKKKTFSFLTLICVPIGARTSKTKKKQTFLVFGFRRPDWTDLRSFFIVWVFRPGCFIQTTTEKHPGFQNLRTPFFSLYSVGVWVRGVLENCFWNSKQNPRELSFDL